MSWARWIDRLLLGSVSTGLIHHGHGLIAIVHAEETPVADAPVLVGIDGSASAEAATAFAFNEASRRGVDLVALHAWSDAGIFTADWHEYENQGREVLAERLAGWQQQYPDMHVQRRLVRGDPARRLSEESQHSQLVVVGSHGLGGFPPLDYGEWTMAKPQHVVRVTAHLGLRPGRALSRHHDGARRRRRWRYSGSADTSRLASRNTVRGSVGRSLCAGVQSSPS